MMGEKGLQAVIFDLDGTLLDSMHVWEQVDQRFLRENRILPPAGISDRLKTMGIREAAAFFISEFALDMTPEQVIARIENLAAEEYRLRIPLKPGVLEVLDGLDARHIPYCIATATYDSLVEAALERLGIRHRFRFVLTCSQVGSTKAKPDIYLECARRLGMRPGKSSWRRMPSTLSKPPTVPDFSPSGSMSLPQRRTGSGSGRSAAAGAWS